MEVISHARAIMGVLEKDGVVLAAEKEVPPGTFSSTSTGVAGLTADANSLINYAAQRHLFSFNEDIPVEQLAEQLCDLKQGYTQYGGLHPFGLSLLYAGYDPHCQFQLHPSDLSGNYSGWTVMCIGTNNDTAQCLKQECKDDLCTEEAIALMIKIMSKTMDSTTLSSGKCMHFIYKPAEIDALLAKHGIEKMAS
ncbi:hypothetical protein BS47DRAFT_1373862 [Hydnum rufescens UP504]|uniref:Uncharacterized protein n=1 Tax=Hydnum rufescens UP504 TaxID=1448309 RepID=A0A9P6AKN0_9AGAM|nr:hypothetical protein BS47DRAFT_1373862 [Hydnum rufescens UP504]